MGAEGRFRGAWGSLFEGYVGYRVASGLKAGDGYIYKLATLCDHLKDAGADPGMLTEEHVTSWLRTHEGKSANTISAYESMSRRFALYLRAKGFDAWVLPGQLITRPPGKFAPYVFTSDEVRRIFAACDEARDSGPGSRGRRLYQTLFRLLYSTGMRVGEAVALGMSDVDLGEDVITVLDGKGGVSRLVPFHPSLHPWLESWMGSDERRRRGGDRLFESPYGGPMGTHPVFDRFANVVLPAAGIARVPGRRVCVHSLRHTFACHALDAAARSGIDPQTALPLLATYLGHVDIRSTELYLRLTEERFGGIVEAGHHVYDGLFGGGPSA